MGASNDSTGFLRNQVELSNILRRYWSDLVHWTWTVFVSRLFDLEHLPVLQRRMLKNASDIASVFGSLYGNAVATRLERVLSEHYNTLFAMSEALATGDMETANVLNQRLYQQLDDVVEILGNANSNIDKAELQVLLYNFLSLTEEEAMLIFSRQYDESTAQYDRIYDQAMRIADYLGYAIIRQLRA